MNNSYLTGTLFKVDAENLKRAIDDLMKENTHEHAGVTQMLLNRVAMQAIQMSASMERKWHG